MKVRPHRPSIATTESLLHALIRNIDYSRESSTHLRETEDFLVAIKEHLVWYDRILHIVWADEERFPPEEVADTVGVVENLVYEVIESVKGLCDGTTDRIPFSLATLLNHEFERYIKSDTEDRGRTADTEDQRRGVALYPVTEVNYYYEDVSDAIGNAFHDLDIWLVDVVLSRLDPEPIHDPPDFPRSLIAIGFQYAMVDDVLYNGILFHELGHYVFKRRKLDERFRKLVEQSLRRKFRQFSAYKDYIDRKIYADAREFVDGQVNIVLSWIMELFCDAFGVAIMGPAYAFAFRDLAGPQSRSTAFFVTHPADLLRQQIQWHVLQKTEWSIAPTKVTKGARQFVKTASDVFAHLRSERLPRLDKWDVDALKYVSHETIAPVLIKELSRHRTRIVEAAIKSVDDWSERRNDFWALGPTVATALEHGIVPSTVVLARANPEFSQVKSTKLRGRRRCYHPLPSTVMNVGRILFHTGCPELRANWPRRQGGSPSHDDILQIHRRLSEWVQKAIMDWLLIKGAAKRAPQPK